MKVALSQLGSVSRSSFVSRKMTAFYVLTLHSIWYHGASFVAAKLALLAATTSNFPLSVTSKTQVGQVHACRFAAWSRGKHRPSGPSSIPVWSSSSPRLEIRELHVHIHTPASASRPLSSRRHTQRGAAELLQVIYNLQISSSFLSLCFSLDPIVQIPSTSPVNPPQAPPLPSEQRGRSGVCGRPAEHHYTTTSANLTLTAFFSRMIPSTLHVY